MQAIHTENHHQARNNDAFGYRLAKRTFNCFNCSATFSAMVQLEEGKQPEQPPCPKCPSHPVAQPFEENRRMVSRAFNCRQCWVQFRALVNVANESDIQMPECVRCKGNQVELAYLNSEQQQRARVEIPARSEQTQPAQQQRTYQQPEQQPDQNPFHFFSMFVNQEQEQQQEANQGTETAFIDQLPEADCCEGKECYICLDALKKKQEGSTEKVTAKLPCGHEFDRDCLKKWLDEHHSCPVCRHELPKQQKEETQSNNRSRHQHLPFDFFEGFNGFNLGGFSGFNFPTRQRRVDPFAQFFSRSFF